MKKAKTNDHPTELRISDSLQQILREQTIDADRPGSVLRDFETLLDFIGERGVKTTSKDYLLPQSGLEKLNAEMTRPVAHQLKRPQQRSFPLLNALFLLLRTTGIGVGIGAAPSGKLALDPEMLMKWRQMNSTEQYFTLLENWLCRASTETIGEGDRWSDICRNSLTGVCRQLEWKPVLRAEDSNRRYGIVYSAMDFLTIALMDAFGWVSTEYEPPADRHTHQLSRVEFLPFGQAMIDVLSKSIVFEFMTAAEFKSLKLGVLQPVFTPCFPTWHQNLKLPEPEVRPGKYTWRVSLGKPWRRIEIPGELSLESLAAAILDAFDFDNDHVYHFEFRDRRSQTVRIACPHVNDADAWADEVAIQDLPLAEGATMTFVFDYGDNWKFTLKLESVTDVDRKLKGPKVIQSSGTAPVQYDMDED